MGREEGGVLAGGQHQETRTWPFCTFAGPQEGGGRGGVKLFFKLLAKKPVGGKWLAVEGSGESCRECRKSEPDSFSPGLKLGVEIAINRGVDPVWSSLRSFSSLPCNGPGSQQAQVQLQAPHCTGHAVAIQNHDSV